MAIKYISDLHLGHANCIAFDGRPFKDVDEMDSEIIRIWNENVDRKDTVYILGDMIWAKEAEWPKYLEQMAGDKVLVKGNHDLKHFSGKTEKYFEDICDYKEIKDEGRRVLMSHYPMPFHKSAYDPNVYMLYGHVHNSREHILMLQLRELIRRTKDGGDHRAVGNWFNVGCMLPWIQYAPKTLDEILDADENFVLLRDSGNHGSCLSIKGCDLT